MSDCRSEFLKSVEESLVEVLDSEKFSIVTNKIIRILSDYEITERCTDVAVVDPVNEKLLKTYCACLLVDGKSKKTIYAYNRSIQRFSDFIQKPFTEVDAYDIRYYLE